jgi:hypothetical protein
MRDQSAIKARANRAVQRTFGVSVLYTLVPEGLALSIVAPFNANYALVDTTGEVPVSTTGPVVSVCIADLPRAPKPEDTCVIGGQAYKVIDVQPNGSGITPCILHEVK